MAQKPDLAKHELWRQRLQEFQRGNETIVEFCRRCGVAVWSFYYWRNKFQSGVVAAATREPGNGSVTATRQTRLVPRVRHAATPSRLEFVPIQISGAQRVEVHLTDGTRVTIPCQDHAAIGAVISALVSEERRTC